MSKGEEKTPEDILRCAELVREQMEIEFIRTNDLKKARKVWDRLASTFNAELEDKLKEHEDEFLWEDQPDAAKEEE